MDESASAVHSSLWMMRVELSRAEANRVACVGTSRNRLKVRLVQRRGRAWVGTGRTRLCVCLVWRGVAFFRAAVKKLGATCA